VISIITALFSLDLGVRVQVAGKVAQKLRHRAGKVRLIPLHQFTSATPPQPATWTFIPGHTVKMPTVPFKVKAVYEYNSGVEDDLQFDNGQIITVTDDEEADWYTGEYVNAAGEKIEGLFPRNFVEKYEPAIPSRPARAPKRAPATEPLEPVQEQTAPPPAAASVRSPEPTHEEEHAMSQEPEPSARAEPVPQSAAPKHVPAASAQTTNQTSPVLAAKSPPPVAEKPSSNSFKDRIAAFNKPAASPITPFKPGGGGPSTGFIKKPFVAPPPSRNAYVPPPRETPVQKPYHREEDTDLQEAEPVRASEPTASAAEDEEEDQPKPVSLKERIALLQKQQAEAAARSVEKKDKPKKPPKKKPEATESNEQAPVSEAPPLIRHGSGDTVGRPSGEHVEESREPPPPPRRTNTGLSAHQTSHGLVSDTGNEADESEAADDDGLGTSTEEERPGSRRNEIPIPAAAPLPRRSTDSQPEAKPTGAVEDDEDEEEEEEDEETEEERRKRELRERMAKMSGGMGMMGMFGAGAPRGPPPAARKPKASSTEASRQMSESHAHEEERAAPVRIMALPGMGASIPSRQEEAMAEPENEDGSTARPTPDTLAHADDYIAQPPPRRSTYRTAPPVPQGVHQRILYGQRTNIYQIEERHLHLHDKTVAQPRRRHLVGREAHLPYLNHRSVSVDRLELADRN
jgi:myosin tail region-interacting protein MTI1